MKKVRIFEAKTHLSSLVKDVENGESFAITKRNLPVAMLVPINEGVRSSGLQSIERIRQLRTELSGRVSLDEILQFRDEGRK
ncbi:MAG: type II toxin-antitoxin system prevent-host-death family antitoxin [Gammaproteobacteria bacterium]|nr:type II toxin-antitoxin system prevent-host-death family antitoxin [Gammaproteobacteria bacterium]